jgi:hypothetical protein
MEKTVVMDGQFPKETQLAFPIFRMKLRELEIMAWWSPPGWRLMGRKDWMLLRQESTSMPPF